MEPAESESQTAGSVQRFLPHHIKIMKVALVCVYIYIYLYIIFFIGHSELTKLSNEIH